MGVKITAPNKETEQELAERFVSSPHGSYHSNVDVVIEDIHSSISFREDK